MKNIFILASYKLQSKIITILYYCFCILFVHSVISYYNIIYIYILLNKTESERNRIFIFSINTKFLSIYEYVLVFLSFLELFSNNEEKSSYIYWNNIWSQIQFQI